MTDVTAEELIRRIGASERPVILDVRSGAEFVAGHVPDAIHVPFWAVLWRSGDLGIGHDDPIVVYCGHGPRAELARALLRARGFTRVSCLAGHMAGWRQAGYPEER